jgi:hypothetical protein
MHRNTSTGWSALFIRYTKAKSGLNDETWEQKLLWEASFQCRRSKRFQLVLFSDMWTVHNSINISTTAISQTNKYFCSANSVHVQGPV